MLKCVCVCVCVCVRVCVFEDLYSCVSVHMSCAMHAYLCAWGHECVCICVHKDLNACLSVYIKLQNVWSNATQLMVITRINCIFFIPENLTVMR